MLNNDSKDIVTKTLNRALDILFVNNPKSTSMGVLFGIIVKQISDIILNVISIVWRLSYILCISTGIFLFNIPNLYRKYKLDESLEVMMHYINEGQKKQGLSQKDKREQWKEFIKYVYDKIYFDTLNKN